MAFRWFHRLGSLVRSFYKLTSGKNHFFIVSFFQAIACVALPSERPLLRRIWNVYRSCMVLHYVLCVTRCIMTARSGQSFNAVLNNTHVVFSLTINYLRSLIIHASFEHFVKVRNFINDRGYRKDEFRSGEIRQKAYEHSIRVTLIFIANIIFQSITIPISGMTDTEPFQIPIDLGSLPKVFKKGIEIWYNFSFIPSSYIAASNFLSIYLAMIGLRAELRIAHDSISNIPNKVKYLNSIDGKDELFEQKKEFWIDLHSELKQSIQHHVEVLINLNILKNVTNLSFMLLYYMTMILIAAGVLIVIFNPVVDVFYVFAIDYTFRYVLECFVFCYTVSSLNATVRILLICHEQIIENYIP